MRKVDLNALAEAYQYAFEVFERFEVMPDEAMRPLHGEAGGPTVLVTSMRWRGWWRGQEHCALIEQYGIGVVLNEAEEQVRCLLAEHLVHHAANAALSIVRDGGRHAEA